MVFDDVAKKIKQITQTFEIQTNQAHKTQTTQNLMTSAHPMFFGGCQYPPGFKIIKHH
jgi:hypothetical protein